MPDLPDVMKEMQILREAVAELPEVKHERDKFRAALIEIRDVANVSTGVEWYAMIAQKALDGEDDFEAEMEDRARADLTKLGLAILNLVKIER